MTYEEQLLALAREDERIVVMTAENRAAIRGLPAQLGERFIDVGICEQTMVGAAAGLALRGRIPVLHALATFLTMRAFEFIRTDVGIGGLPVKLVGAVPGFLSDGNGPTHQALEDIAIMRGIPGMQVFCPADNDELLAGLPAMLATPFPCYIRYNAMPAVVRHHEPFAPGRAEQFGEGSDVALLTYGFLLREVLEAQRLLEAEGLACRVVNLRTLAPLDKDMLLSAVAACGTVVTVEDHFLTGGLYSILAELLLAHGMTASVLPIAMDSRWFRPATLPRMLEHEHFTGAHIARRILHSLAPEEEFVRGNGQPLFKTYL